MHDTEIAEATEDLLAPGQGSFWTLQQFSTGPTGKPWLALQQQNDAGVQWGTTGYRHEIDALCRKHGILPQELEPITEDEYYRRMAGDMPATPAAVTRTPGRALWDPH